MSQTLFAKLTDPAVATLVNATFPGLKLRDAAIRIHDKGGVSLTSYWSGGTRDYHKVVKLDTMEVFSVPENGSGFTAVDRAYGPSGLPLELPAPGYAVVTHTYGHHCSLAISIHSENAAELLPAPVETTWAEKVVLVATRSLKSSYAGRTRQEEAARETGITASEYETAKSSLIARGLLNKAGAITTEGRNAAGSKDLYRLAQERSTKRVVLVCIECGHVANVQTNCRLWACAVCTLIQPNTNAEVK